MTLTVGPHGILIEVVGTQVDIKIIRRLETQLGATTDPVDTVEILIEKNVVDETVLVHFGQCEATRYTLSQRATDIALKLGVVVVAYLGHERRFALLRWLAGVDADRPGNGVDAKECSLGPAQDLDTLYTLEISIKTA